MSLFFFKDNCSCFEISPNYLIQDFDTTKYFTPSRTQSTMSPISLRPFCTNKYVICALQRTWKSCPQTNNLFFNAKNIFENSYSNIIISSIVNHNTWNLILNPPISGIFLKRINNNNLIMWRWDITKIQTRFCKHQSNLQNDM